LVESAKMTGIFFQFSELTHALICLPLDYVSGKMMLVRSMVFDMQTIFTKPSEPLEYPEELTPNFAAMTPYQYEKCLNANAEKLLKIKTILLGGGPISSNLQDRIIESGQNVFLSYGMTETYSHIALKKITRSSPSFKTLNGITCSTNKDKTLVIHAPMLGIKKLKTNDLVHLIDEQNFDFIGRIDNVINSGGIKLHPEEIERKLAALHWTVPFFTIGLPDEKLGQKLVLCIESENALNLSSIAEVLSKFEQPKEVFYFKKFNYTGSGKINRSLTIKNYYS